MKNKNLYKSLKVLRSMQFGLALLAILVIASMIGSVVPQERELAFYQNQYSGLKSNLILNFGLNDVYGSWYFIGLFGLLCVNLTLCSITRFGSIIHRMKALPRGENTTPTETISFKQQENQEEYVNDLFEVMGFKRVKKKEENGKVLYVGKKFTIGYLGSWLIHLGFLITIISYGYGQYTNFSTSVYGVPGSLVEVEGTDLRVEIEDFRVDYREDGSVNQYYTNMRLLDNHEEVLKAQEIYVNNPLSHNGYNFYQSATGWAADLVFMKDNEIVEDVLYEGTVFIEDSEEVAIHFAKFYPDFIATERGLFSRSHLTDNPMFLYSLFFNGRRVEMNVVAPGEIIEWNEYQILLENPRMYTYLQVNKLKGKVGAIAGSILAMIGLILAFYIKPVTLMVKKEKNKLHIYGNDIGKINSTKYKNHQLDI